MEECDEDDVVESLDGRLGCNEEVTGLSLVGIVICFIVVTCKLKGK